MSPAPPDLLPALRLRFEPTEMARFGRRLARLTLGDGTAPAVRDILALCEAERVDMLTLRVPTDRLALVQALEAHGFRLMDCLVYYEAPSVLAGRVAPVPLRIATAADAAEVGRIARACFADYRSHYHADPRLDPADIAEGYVEWAQRSCCDPAVADAVFLPIVDGKVAGFATMRGNGPDEGEGVLFAVAPEAAGSGVYGALIERGLDWCARTGRGRMIMSTQIDNRRVQRSVTNRGFRLFRSYYTFHRWFD